MFINVSNHPSSKWNKDQLEAARTLGGEVMDVQFPAVDPHWETWEVEREALRLFEEKIEFSTVHVIQDTDIEDH